MKLKTPKLIEYWSISRYHEHELKSKLTHMRSAVPGLVLMEMLHVILGQQPFDLTQYRKQKVYGSLEELAPTRLESCVGNRLG